MQANIDNENEQKALDDVIHEVREQFRILGGKRKDLIIQLGSQIEKTTSDIESTCEQIKYYLAEEITEGLILKRDIERYCPEKWKKKTKPKKEKQNDR